MDGSHRPDRFLWAPQLTADVALLQSGQRQLDQSWRDVRHLGCERNKGSGALWDTQKELVELVKLSIQPSITGR